MLKGWLDILLTKTTPKPEEFYIKNFEKAFCNLSTQGTVNLLINVSAYLTNNLFLGGNEGVELSSELTILNLTLGIFYF